MRKNAPENNVLPTPDVADKAAKRKARFITGRLIRRGKAEDFPGGRSVKTAVSSERKRRRLGGNGAGFLVSLIVHAAFLVFAIFWITERIRNVPEKEEIQAFVTGSGGGKGGETPGNLGRRPKPLKVRAPRIVSRSASAAIALPEFNVKMPNLPDVSQSLGALSSEGLVLGGGGFGGGSGGGIGTGKGIGIGNAKNYVGDFMPRKVMGATILARKVAVYLDCSGSMSPYLPQVRKEIYDKYPDADIFEFDGIRTLVHDGEIVGGRSDRMKDDSYGRYGVRLDGTEKEKLSNNGKRIHKKYAENFERGSVGAWIDVMIQEKYDALVIFSDFQDGLRQFNKEGKTIFADSVYSPSEADERKHRDLRWQTRWQTHLKRRKNNLRLYLFTIGVDPQKFLADCVALSGGEIADVRYLRKETLREEISSRRKSSRSRNKAPAEKESPVEFSDDS